MISFPELTPNEAESLAELSGKFMDSGIDREQADIKALKTILERRKEKDLLLKTYFELIITTGIMPVAYIKK
jgi:hypothetical protein